MEKYVAPIITLYVAKDPIITLPIEEEGCMFKNIDVMVTRPLVDSNLEAASEKSLAAANAGVKMKKKHYKAWSEYQHDHRTGQEFIPFVLECFLRRRNSQER